MALDQLAMSVFGLTAMYWSQGSNALLRRWAPIVGLAGQPAWAWYAWNAHQHGADSRGLGLLIVAYVFVYIRGACVQWRKEPAA